MESKKIAYFGAEGAFTHLAALQLCSENKDLQLVNENFIRILDAENILSEKKADYCVVPAENSTVSSAVQPRKAHVPTEVRVEGRVTDFSAVQFSKDSLPMRSTPSGMWTSTSAGQFSQNPVGIFFMSAGKVMLCSSGQPENAS